MTGTKAGKSVFWDFFTTIRACEQFISDHRIKPRPPPRYQLASGKTAACDLGSKRSTLKPPGLSANLIA